MNVRGNYVDGNTFVVVENDRNRVTAEGDKGSPFFSQVNVYMRKNARWVEVIAWDCVEWQEQGNEAFEAILGVIAKVAAGVLVSRPT